MYIHVQLSRKHSLTCELMIGMLSLCCKLMIFPIDLLLVDSNATKTPGTPALTASSWQAMSADNVSLK